MKSFHALPHFNKYAWQGGPTLPDPKTGWVILNPGGGHPGNDQQHAAIRRWVAPRDGVFAITGTLVHNQDQGDGVQARIVSSRSGVVGTWTVQNSKKDTAVRRLEVKRGDTVDFVVDCRTGPNFDAYAWDPTIRLVGQPAAAKEGERVQWTASTDFSGPQARPASALGPWEKYAQVLLLSNEFAFVD